MHPFLRRQGIRPDLDLDALELLATHGERRQGKPSAAALLSIVNSSNQSGMKCVKPSGEIAQIIVRRLASASSAARPIAGFHGS